MRESKDQTPDDQDRLALTAEQGAALNEFCRLAEEGLNSGPPIDGQVAFERLIRRLQARIERGPHANV